MDLMEAVEEKDCFVSFEIVKSLKEAVLYRTRFNNDC